MSGAPLSSETTAAQFLPPPDPRKETRGTIGGRGGSNLRGYILHNTTCTFESHSKSDTDTQINTSCCTHTGYKG